MKYLLLPLFLALCSPCWGQDQRATEVIKSDLIEAPDSVQPGRLISIKLPPNLPFVVEPKPENKLSFIDEESGKRAYLILEAKAPGYTVTIDYAVIHPTQQEIEKAPWDDREKFAKWIAENRTDEVYRDSHFIKVGDAPDPPGPDPGPEPKPPTDPQSRKVYDAAIANKLPAGECRQVADNMRAVVSQAVATPMTVEEIRQEIKRRNEPVTSGKPGWDAWEKTLAGIFTVTTKEQAVEAYDKIAAGLEAVK